MSVGRGCYWLCECVTVAMNGCWLMWLGDCCIRLCWWGLCSCWENCTGCSAARLPATLLITGTDCDCDVFKPARGKKHSVRLKAILQGGCVCVWGGLTLGYSHDSGERHDEVLRLLVAVMGTVDVGQRADRRKASTRAWNLRKDMKETKWVQRATPHTCERNQLLCKST